MLKKIRDKILPLHLSVILVMVIFFTCMIPAIIYGRILMESFAQAEIEERRISLQSQALIITDNITTSAYLSRTEKNDGVTFAQIDASIRNLADIYSGRILIVDRDYRIIKDTFDLSEGSFHIAKEIMECFAGMNTNSYNRKKDYLIQTLPIYSNVETGVTLEAPMEITKEASIEGVMLIYSSTRGERNILEDTKERMFMLEIILSMLILAFAIFISTAIVRPFRKLSESVLVVSEGVLDEVVDVNTYFITAKISGAINKIFRRLKDINMSRDEFVANVSHELKTPITSIRILADSLMYAKDVTPEQYQEFMEDISYEIDRESKIIDDLLSLVKLDKAETELITRNIQIDTLIEQIIKRLAPIAEKREIKISFTRMREVEAEVDETKLSLAISNLIENAIKYNVDAGWVRVSLDADHKFFYIKVIDSGVGIPAEFHEMIFERFYRVDKARSRETGGTGLGLAITKNIVARHKGMIKVSSKEGEGTSFLVRIPLTYRKNKMK